MLSLDDVAWEKLQHAYGFAESIPKLLRQLQTYPKSEGYQSEPYFSLWSSLCHQGDIYTASFAATPHLVKAGETSPEKVHWSVAQLAVCIEIARLNGRGPEIPTFLQDDYLNAVSKLPELVLNIHKSNPSSETVTIGSAAYAISIGDGRYAEALLELTSNVSQEFLDWFFSR